MNKRHISVILVSLLFCLCGCFMFAACGEQQETTASSDTTQNTHKNSIKIATKNTPEQNILATLAKVLIENKLDAKVKIVYYDDSTSASLLEKLKDGKIDIFFDYTGSLAVNGLGYDAKDIDIPSLQTDVHNDIRKEYDATVSESLGYSSNIAVYMTIEKLQEKGYLTVSNLAKDAPKLKIGMNEAFYNRADSFKEFCKTYDTTFKKAKVYPEEEGFFALINGKIDVLIADSVSPYRSLLNVKTVTDDLYFFLPQKAVSVTANRTLNSYPQLEATLSNLENLITASKMSLMVKRINWEGNDIEDYIYTYLRANNLI